MLCRSAVKGGANPVGVAFTLMVEFVTIDELGPFATSVETLFSSLALLILMISSP